MLYANDFDIETWCQRWRWSGGRRLDAALVLRHMAEEANRVSDGWAYWRAPCAAAAGMIELASGDTPDTPAQWRKACAAVKRFYTMRGDAAGMTRPAALRVAP